MKLKAVLFSSFLASCSIGQVNAQTNIITENFDGVVFPAMPANWLSTDVAGTTWRSDSTHSSSGYTSASGINRISRSATSGSLFFATNSQIRKSRIQIHL